MATQLYWLSYYSQDVYSCSWCGSVQFPVRCGYVGVAPGIPLGTEWLLPVSIRRGISCPLSIPSTIHSLLKGILMHFSATAAAAPTVAGLLNLESAAEFVGRHSSSSYAVNR